MHKKHQTLSTMTNLSLLLTGMAMSFSGFLIQINYHMGHHKSDDNLNLVLGLDHLVWLNVHRTSIVLFSVLAFIHVALHWKWYQTVFSKRVFAKNKLLISLTTVFILSAITGYIPWFIALIEGSPMARKFVVEIHDKLTFALFGCLIVHAFKRRRWFVKRFFNRSIKGASCQ